MSNVQSNYSTTPSANTSLGGLSMAEGTTQIRALNDAIRKLMADIREDSNEIRSMITGADTSISSLATEVTDALNSVNQIVATFDSFQDTLNGALDSASAARTAAEQAADSAGSAEQAVDEFAERIGTVETLAEDNQTTLLEALADIADLKASGVAAGYVQVDETMRNFDNVLSVRNVAIGGSTADLASDRGQLGRTAVLAITSMDAFTSDGWYAVSPSCGDTPESGMEGIVRVSSGYASGSIVQEFFSYGTRPRLFLRSSADAGVEWTTWCEVPTSIGSGLTYSNGTLTVGTMTGSDGTTGGTAGLVPAPASDQSNYALFGDATWRAVASASEMAELSYQATTLSDDLAALSASHELLAAGAVKDTGDQTIYGVKTFVDAIAGTVQRAVGNEDGENIDSTYVRQDEPLADVDVEDIFVNDELYAPLISSSAVGAALDDLSALAQEYITATAQAYFNSQLATKANTASPSLSGTPTAPTPSTGSNSTQIANTAFVQSTVSSSVASAVSDVVGNAPDDLNTLKEISDAIGGDAMFAATVDGKLATKVTTGSSAYVKGVSVSGRNVTITFGDNSTATIQTQDTTYDPLSASDVADVFEGDI